MQVVPRLCRPQPLSGRIRPRRVPPGQGPDALLHLLRHREDGGGHGRGRIGGRVRLRQGRGHHPSLQGGRGGLALREREEKVEVIIFFRKKYKFYIFNFQCVQYLKSLVCNDVPGVKVYFLYDNAFVSKQGCNSELSS